MVAVVLTIDEGMVLTLLIITVIRSFYFVTTRARTKRKLQRHSSIIVILVVFVERRHARRSRDASDAEYTRALLSRLPNYITVCDRTDRLTITSILIDILIDNRSDQSVGLSRAVERLGRRPRPA